jgi:hypothetical protein
MLAAETRACGHFGHLLRLTTLRARSRVRAIRAYQDEVSEVSETLCSWIELALARVLLATFPWGNSNPDRALAQVGLWLGWGQ